MPEPFMDASSTVLHAIRRIYGFHGGRLVYI